VEGVYLNYGDICPLPKIMELKDKYKYRLIMDDGCGIGSIGKTGRGTCEYYDIPIRSVDILAGNLETVTGSVGGFCCGSTRIVFHQRLNSVGYVYSASLPPLLATASIVSFDIMDENPNIFSTLTRNTEFMYKGLSSIPGITVTSAINIPIIHLRLTQNYPERIVAEKILQDVVDEALTRGVLLTRAKYVHADEKFVPSPSIRVFVTSALSQQQLAQALDAIKSSFAKVLTGQSLSSSGPQTPSRMTTRSMSKQTKD